MRLVKLSILLITVATAFLTGCNSKNIKPIENGNDIGVVLMHGKGGTTEWIDSLASSLRSAGINVVTPSMPWHRDRIYDRTFEQSMSEINGYVDKLKASGSKSVFVAGHSLGAVAAAGYAARYNDIAGIILLAPGHFVAWPGFHAVVADDLANADAMIAAGKGDATGSYKDINGPKRPSRVVKAAIYKSWFSDTGPAEFVSNMKGVKGSIPILYVAGSQDRIPQTKNRGYAFDLAPENPKSEFVIIDSSHLDVPRKADEVVIEWLREQ